MEKNNPERQIQEELSRINAMLHDPGFTVVVAERQEAAYHKALGNQPPVFLPPENEVIIKNAREEKMAVHLAGFYAVECSTGAFIARSGSTPVYWLRRITDKSLDADSQLLLNCFTYATSLAALSFPGMAPKQGDQFTSLLFSAKPSMTYSDTVVRTAASRLLDSLKDVVNQPVHQQWEKIGHLLRDKQFTTDVAQHLEKIVATATSGQYPRTISLAVANDTQTVARKAWEEKVAVNAAGLYAVACGLGYLCRTHHRLPSAILNSIVSGNLPEQERQLFERFANATWKAGQPFRGLDHITRAVFQPFDLLPPAEREKDWVQIQTAAAAILQHW